MSALVFVASACGSSDTSVEAGPSTETPTTTESTAATAEESPTTTDQGATAEPPAGDDTVALEWTQAGLSGETSGATLLATDTGFVGFVAYEGAPTIDAFESESGVEWATADAVFGSGGSVNGFYGITPGGPGYVAFGVVTDEVMWISDDGLIWTRHDLDLEYPELGVFNSVEVDSVVVGHDGLVLVGRMDRESPDEHRFFVWTSPDGSDWTLVADAFPDGAYIGDILPTATGFIAKGFVDGSEGGPIWSSEDGSSWDEVDTEAMDADPYGLTHLDLEIWNDKILAVGETEQGFVIWQSSDGDTWEQLPASPLLAHTDQLHVSLDQFSAGPAGIVVAGEITQESQREPLIVVIEKDDVVLTQDIFSDSGQLTVEDRSTGTILIDADIMSVASGEVDGLVFSEDFGSIIFTHPETGAQTTFTEEDFERAHIEANEAAGIEPGSEGEEPLTTSVIWFSPDGQRWTSIEVEETFGTRSLPDPDNGVVVGNDAVILRWLDFPGHGDESGGDTTATAAPSGGDGEASHGVDVIWVGRLNSGS